jgi:hypothetical protein
MADTDGPLKRLVSTFSTDFAAWLLKAEVREARPLNVELPGETLAVDQVFHITLADGRESLLHIEFQGRSSRAPMRWRVLEYMVRLAVNYRLELLSVVIYVGYGVGAQDTGQYQVQSPTGMISLSWQYEVIRLWQMSAESLLALHRAALMPLVGQTQITQPQEVLPTVVARIQQEPDAERRQQLVTGLLALLAEEEWVHMVERLLTEDWLVDESPYLRRIREEGSLTTRRRDILTVLAARFALSETVRQQVEQRLATYTDETVLATLLAAAARSVHLAEFLAILMSPEQG